MRPSSTRRCVGNGRRREVDEGGMTGMVALPANCQIRYSGGIHGVVRVVSARTVPLGGQWPCRMWLPNHRGVTAAAVALRPVVGRIFRLNCHPAPAVGGVSREKPSARALQAGRQAGCQASTEGGGDVHLLVPGTAGNGYGVQAGAGKGAEGRWPRSHARRRGLLVWGGVTPESSSQQPCTRVSEPLTVTAWAW